jgi:transcription termination factor Rho
MAAGPQLERSLLERKERDELKLIAESLGVKSVARSKKEDLVDKILQATGVANGGGEEAPSAAKRRRVAKPQAAEAESTNGDEAPASPSPRRSPAAAESDSGGTVQMTMTETGEVASTTPVSTESNGEAREHRPPREPRNDGRDNRPNRNNQNRNNQGGGDFDSNDPNSRRSRRRRRGRTRTGGGEGDLQSEPREEQFSGDPVEVAGFLDLHDQGYGFVRTRGFRAHRDDVYVPVGLVRKLGLRKGDWITGMYRPATGTEKFPPLLRVDTVSGKDPEEARTRPRFEELTPLFPDVKLRLERQVATNAMTARIIDLIAPIGKGQRGLIVSPPKAGKTTVMKQIAQSIELNNPEVHLMVLLVDERPEEVTDMRRTVQGEVVASTFDRPSDEHTQVAELAIERAKRLVEDGKDVVIILDGITRLARAYNLAAPATGRIMSGGIDTGALYPPKKFFGAARNTEEGGSLTILATALVETGSKMDEVIYEEFKGTGNMELRLDRKLAERRIYPAIDPLSSSTRHEELLFEPDQLKQVWKLRRVLNAVASDGSNAAAVEMLMGKIKETPNNDVFLAEIAKNSQANG